MRTPLNTVMTAMKAMASATAVPNSMDMRNLLFGSYFKRIAGNGVNLHLRTFGQLNRVRRLKLGIPQRARPGDLPQLPWFKPAFGDKRRLADKIVVLHFAATGFAVQAESAQRFPQQRGPA